MWGQYHPVPYKSKIKETFLRVFGINLSLDQTLWWAAGAFLSYRFAKLVPPIGNDWLYSRLHQFIPFALCLYLCYGKHQKTGLPIWRYYRLIIGLRLRQRRFTYRKFRTPAWNEAKR
ncbi:hypothetical protein D3C81_1087240 [compost metagenome]